MKLDSQKMISGEKRISRPRTSQSARSRIKGPIYQEEDPSNFWEVDLSFRPIDISIFARNRQLLPIAEASRPKKSADSDQEEPGEGQGEGSYESEEYEEDFRILTGRNQGFRHNFSSYAEWEKTYGYQLSSGSGSESDDSDLDSDEKKNADLPDKFRLRFTDIGNNETIKYTGMPFIIVSKYERHCLFGKDKNKKKKERYQNSRSKALSDDHPSSLKRRQHIQSTKKKGCPAKIVMKEVLVFPEYKAKQDTEKARRIASEKLREDLEVMGSNMKREHRIYISLPKDEEHQNMHLLGQITGFMNPVNKEVREKLYEMVGHGVTSVSEMRRHLKVYVDTQLFPSASKPSLTDAAYYPSDVTIRKHIYLAQLRLRYSKIDQENLMKLVSQWQESYPKDNFDFMPATSNENQPLDEDNINDVQCVEQDDEDEVFSQLITTTNFFFCHQSEFQRHLLYRYGNSLCLLDATYRTTKYALPLFFLAVKTNVGFSVVAEFVVQNETKNLIVQGLQTIKNWMNEAPDKPEGWEWKPKFFMTDFCEREIVAIEETFSESFVFLCDFHREQSWTRWVSKTDNGVGESKDKVLAMLRRCAHSCSEDQFEVALESLTNSVEWKANARLRNWFTKTWLSEKKRWVWAHRYGQGLLVNTNNGLERQNKIFKYKFLEQRKDNHLSGMISSLVSEYLPAMMLKYTRDNVLASERVGRSYIAAIPDFLKNRPAPFIKHCMTKIDLAETVEETDIIQLSTNCFKIKSVSDSRKKVEYNVLLDNGHGMPSCGCHAWTWTLLPCKHIFAVINGRFPGVTWKNIPLSYSNSPFFTLDFDVVSIPVSGFVSNEDDLCDEEDVEDDITDVELSDANLPTCKKTPRSKLKILAIKCRESLSIIQNATYLCQEESTLEHLSVLLNEASSYMNNMLHKEEGLIPEPPKKRKVVEDPKSAKKPKLGTKSEKCLKLRKRKANRSIRYGKTTSKTIKLEDLKKDQEELEDTIIIDGHSTVPQSILESIEEMVSQMPIIEWEALIVRSTKEAGTSTDKISQIAVSLLEEYCKDDHIQTMKTISDNHCPKDMTNAQKYRMALLMLHKLVETKKFSLKRNFEKERKEREAAEKACIDALAQMEGFNRSKPTSEASEMTTKSKKKGKKKVQWETGESATQCTGTTWTDIDSQKATNKLMKIWNQERATNYIKARVYGYNVNDADLMSLKSPNWLTDQVLDAYLSYLAQKEWDKGKKVKHLGVSKMTSIINDHVQSSEKKCRVLEYDYIIGVYHQRGHWDLVIIEPKSFKVYFYNPLGETTFQRRQVLNGWRNYMGRNLLLSIQWELKVNEHSKQKDGSSCGVFCLMFAERHLSGESLLNITKEDVLRKRTEVGTTLLLFEEHIADCCPCCGLKVDDLKGDLVPCGICKRKFHKKNYCVGDKISNMSSVQHFTCKDCFKQ